MMDWLLVCGVIWFLWNIADAIDRQTSAIHALRESLEKRKGVP